MWSRSKARVAVCLVIAVVAVTDGHPVNDNMLHQNQVQTNLPRQNNIHGNDAKEDSNRLIVDERQSIKSNKKIPAPMVDDDLLEFLVRVADNPTEWNKIRRVLSMLGRDDTSPSTAADNTVVATVATDRAAGTASTTAVRQPRTTAVPRPSPTPPRTTAAAAGAAAERLWPSGEWIADMAERIRAATVARGIGAGGAAGADPYDYDDGGDTYDDDYDHGGANDGDEFEEIDGGGGGGGGGDDEPTIVVAEPPPHPPRPVAGHMSRYQFRRIDGSPGDGRVNGTYVAVFESGRPRRLRPGDAEKSKTH